MQLCFVFLCSLGVALEFAYAGTLPSQSGWLVPQANGSFVWVSSWQYEAQAIAAAIEPRTVQVKFFLYTRNNRNAPQEISAQDANALRRTHFKSGQATRFIIHGWQNNHQSDVNKEIRGALLDTGAYNVICVDWSRHAQTLNYNSARWSVPEVGQAVARLIDFLSQHGGMSFGNLELIGHSLGAHVSGFAGKSVKRGRVRTIIGLDPALPLFTYENCAARLCSSDANFVESIQTNGGLLGFLDPIGKAAFYPNGGRTQPGCGVDISGSCAHGRSYAYYAEAIRRNDFPSMRCSSSDNAVNNKCGSTYSSVRMGAAANYGISGFYYVPVRATSPYGMSG